MLVDHAKDLDENINGAEKPEYAAPSAFIKHQLKMVIEYMLCYRFCSMTIFIKYKNRNSFNS